MLNAGNASACEAVRLHRYPAYAEWFYRNFHAIGGIIFSRIFRVLSIHFGRVWINFFSDAGIMRDR